MRKVTLIATALIAALAMSVGAIAYPLVVGTHPLSAVPRGSSTTATHPSPGDNSTGNETNETGDHPTAPPANETENETSDNETGENETAPAPPAPESNDSGMGNVSVEHNVTEMRVGNTTWINGTIVVAQGTQTLASITFEIVTHDNGTVNMTFNGTNVVGTMDISIHGAALFTPDRGTLDVLGTVTVSQNGTVQWEKTFGFELSPGSEVPA